MFAAPDLDAVALDLPGFGSAPAPPQPWGSVEYTEAVAAVLEEMQERVVVLGHSFGGRVAVQLAASRPGQIGGLVLSGAPLHRATRREQRALTRSSGCRDDMAARGLVSEETDGGDTPASRIRATTGLPPGSCGTVLVRTLAEDYADGARELYMPRRAACGAMTTRRLPLSGGEMARGTAAFGRISWSAPAPAT